MYGAGREGTDKIMSDKYRYEKKYVCSEAQIRMLKMRLNSLLSMDKHAGEDGCYQIRSLYFDDYYDSGYYDNESGVDPREKYRIRIYNGNLDKIRLELKRKQHGKTQKESCPLTKQQCEILMQPRGSVTRPDNLIPGGSYPELLNRLLIARKTVLMQPKVIVEYQRTPYVGKIGNVRITLDQNITGSGHVEEFKENKITARPIMPTGQHLLEVKFDEFLPDYLFKALQLENLRQSAYSKYYLSRKYIN